MAKAAGGPAASIFSPELPRRERSSWPGCGVRRAPTGNLIGIRRHARLVARIAAGFRGIDPARYQQAPAPARPVKIVRLPAIGLGRYRWSRKGYGAAIFGTPPAGLAFPRVGRHLVRGAVASGTAQRQTRAGPPALAAPDARPRRRSIKPLRLVRLVAARRRRKCISSAMNRGCERTCK